MATKPKPKTISLSVPARRLAVIEDVLRRVEKNPDEVAYFEALVEVVEVEDVLKDKEILYSALMSRLAVTAPWMMDRVCGRTV